VTAPLGIDVHAHFFPERFIRAIEESGASSGGGVDRSDPIGPTLVTRASAPRRSSRATGTSASAWPP